MVDEDFIRADELKVGESAVPYVEKVDKSELARLMLDWERKKKELDFIEESIKQDVLALAKTQDVGNVRATYSGGRNKYDYRRVAVRTFTPEELADYTEHIPEQVIPAHDEIDYMKACKDNKVEPDLVEAGTPSVKVKLLK